LARYGGEAPHDLGLPPAHQHCQDVSRRRRAKAEQEHRDAPQARAQA
jgi:hypothetical protein